MKWRDLMCGEPRADQVGERLTLAGWVARRRDHGGLVFIDLRDHTGVCQLVVNPENAPEAAGVAHQVRNEFVLRAEGELVRRESEAINPSLPTGEVELQVDNLEIVSRSDPLPFQLEAYRLVLVVMFARGAAKGWRSSRACATATSTCGATGCRGTSACQVPSSPGCAATWSRRASSTCGLRC